MDADAAKNADNQEQVQFEETGDSARFEFTEILPLAGDTDGSCATEYLNGDWSGEIKEGNLAVVKLEPDVVSCYLCQGGYVFVVVCLSVCLSACWQFCAKTLEQICMKFSEKVGDGSLNKQMVRFWWQSGSLSECKVCFPDFSHWEIRKVVNGHKSFIVICHMAAMVI